MRPPTESPPVGKRPTYYAPPTPSPFNEKTARDAAEQPVVRGRAYVVDGDTIVIKKTQIRLFGVDAPEMNHPYGKKAKWALVKLCKNQEIKAEVTDVDAHGRTVAKCFLPDGRDLSAEMVKLGLAIDWGKFSGGVYRDLEVEDVRKKLWLADARQKGRMHVWDKYDAKQKERQGGG
ncbi:thermonuclease family protein [Celeribacter sp.]|uniref:thermonuclease family protein n=1 Tax=Celeribacter sp. TaxID=1890673 RepID=UPI003A8CCC79